MAKTKKIITDYISHIPKIIPGVAGKVYAQLLHDYPPGSISWVKSTGIIWTGPTHIPLDKIDWKDEASWRASHEPDKVDQHMDLIEANDSVPIIFVLPPKDDKVECIDGHHRLLAYKRLNKPALGYIALVPSDHPNMPWMEMHSKQYSGDSKLELNGTAGQIKET